MKSSAGINWAEHFEAQKASGISVQEYLKLHKLVGSRWYFWRRKLLGDAAKKMRPQFVRAVGGGEDKLSGISIQIEGGIKISFPEDVSLSRLTHVIRALRGVPA